MIERGKEVNSPDTGAESQDFSTKEIYLKPLGKRVCPNWFESEPCFVAEKEKKAKSRTMRYCFSSVGAKRSKSCRERWGARSHAIDEE